MNLRDIHRVYCVGLGGVGVSAVAKYFLAQGVQVSGSDPVHSPLVDDVVRQGGQWFDHPDARRITTDLDLVVYTDDAKPDHPERAAAAAIGVRSENFSTTLGQIMATRRQRLCVAGTNGKSTTTAITGLLLEDAGLHPTVFVGSRVGQFDGNLRMGGGDVFVAEADEYRDHFLNLTPTIATITNIELDHVDYFHTLDRLQDSFHQFADLLPDDGRLVANGDDPGVRDLIDGRSNLTTFGLSERADVRAVEITQTPGRQSFTMVAHGQLLGRCELHLPGYFNITNVLGAVAGAMVAGADPSSFAETIANFRGVWRRFEILNSGSTVTIVNDYAHHPSAVRQTLAGARAFYPGRRIVAVFQPHHHNRLNILFDEFSKSFGAADMVILVDVYTVPGREPLITETKSSADLARAVHQRGIQAERVAHPIDAANRLKEILQPGDVAIIMGAGDIWRIAQPLADYYA